MLRRWIGWLCLGLSACGQALVLTEASTRDPDVVPAAPLADATAAEAAPATDALASFDASPTSDAKGPSNDPAPCLRTEETASKCPATWAETIQTKFDACVRATPPDEWPYGWPLGWSGGRRTRDACDGWLRYEAGFLSLTACLYDPVTEKLAGWGVFEDNDQRVGISCGLDVREFHHAACPMDDCSVIEGPSGAVCPVGVKRCNDRVAETCDTTGQWDRELCALQCIDRSCIECMPNAKDCVGNVPRRCPQGVWQNDPACAHACGAGQCGAACDGTCACTDGVCLPVKLESFASLVATDKTNLYWLAIDPTGASSAGAIMKAPLAGGAAVTLATTSGRVRQMIVDAADIWWAELPEPGKFGALKHVPIAGGSVETFFSKASAPMSFALSADSVFWIEPVPVGGDGDVYRSTVQRAPRAGGAPRWFSEGGDHLLASTTHLYVLSLSLTLQAEPFDGGASTPLAGGDIGVFEVDATRVYWGTRAGLYSRPLAGGASVLLAPFKEGYGGSTSIAVDATHVYWTTTSAVMKVPITGGSPTTLASFGGHAIALSETRVYFASYKGFHSVAK